MARVSSGDAERTVKKSLPIAHFRLGGGILLRFPQGQSILLATPRHVQQQVYMIERLDIDLNDSLRETVRDLLQTALEEGLGDGLGLGGFFQVSSGSIGACEAFWKE